MTSKRGLLAALASWSTSVMLSLNRRYMVALVSTVSIRVMTSVKVLPSARAILLTKVKLSVIVLDPPRLTVLARTTTSINDLPVLRVIPGSTKVNTSTNRRPNSLNTSSTKGIISVNNLVISRLMVSTRVICSVSGLPGIRMILGSTKIIVSVNKRPKLFSATPTNVRVSAKTNTTCLTILSTKVIASVSVRPRVLRIIYTNVIVSLNSRQEVS